MKIHTGHQHTAPGWEEEELLRADITNNRAMDEQLVPSWLATMGTSFSDEAGINKVQQNDLSITIH